MDFTGKRNDGPAASGFRASIVGVILVIAALAGVGRVWTAVTAPWILGAFGLLFVVFRRAAYRWLTSLPFAVAILAAILGAAALGTVIPQGLPADALAKRFGPGAARAIVALGLGDIFHAFAFRGILGVLALSLGLAVVERRGWRPAQWGFLLAHGGVIVVLAGGLAGSLHGMKGFIDLHEGQTAKSVAVTDARGNPTGEKLALPFGLRLDKFEIEKHPPEWRLYVYEPKGEDCRVIASRSLKEATEWSATEGARKSFRLLGVFPDFHLRTELRDSPDGGGAPALQLRVNERDGRGVPVTLLAGTEGRDAVFLRQSRTLVRFAWRLDGAPPIVTESVPEHHRIEVRAREGAGPVDLEVKPGETYRLDDHYALTVFSYLPDFAYDARRREAYSRSSQPKNPALKISLQAAGGRSEERWLFAKNTGYGHEVSDPEAPKLAYRHEPAREPADRELVVVGESREILDFHKGVAAGRLPLRVGSGEPFVEGIDACVERLSPRAVEIRTPITRSAEWRNPVAEVEIRSGTDVTRELLGSGKPIALDDRGTALVFGPKPDDVKSYRSRVAILDAGRAEAGKKIAVNHPLSHGGYTFYQSSYRREDPSYSGLLVVRDPGLAVVYVGFALMCAGVLFKFYVRPRILRWRVGDGA